MFQKCDIFETLFEHLTPFCCARSQMPNFWNAVGIPWLYDGFRVCVKEKTIVKESQLSNSLIGNSRPAQIHPNSITIQKFPASLTIGNFREAQIRPNSLTILKSPAILTICNSRQAQIRLNGLAIDKPPVILTLGNMPHVCNALFVTLFEF